jgi:hypothetical protein
MPFQLFMESDSCNALYLSMVLTSFARAHARASRKYTPKLKNTHSKHLRASRVAGETNSALGVLGRGIWPKRHSAPQDAARSSRIAKSARASGNHTHTAYKCSPLVHFSGSGQGQREIETRRSRRPPEMRASKYGRVLEVDIGKNSRTTRNQPRAVVKCIPLAI